MGNFNNRVMGIVGVRAVMSKTNGDMSGKPKQLPDGELYTSSNSKWYAMKKALEVRGHKVFGLKSLKSVTLQPRTQVERFKQFFGEYKRKSGNNTFTLFYFDGEEISPKIDCKITNKNIKSSNKNDETDPLNIFSKELAKLTKAELIDEIKAKELIENQQEEGYFFYDKKGGLTKLDINEEDKDIFDGLTGGISSGYDVEDAIKQLHTCIDVKFKGIVYTDQALNFNTNGILQIRDSVNISPNSNIINDEILSPYKNSNEKSVDKMKPTMGSKQKVDFACFVHGFDINPVNLNELCKLVRVEKPTNDEIEDLKRAFIEAHDAVQSDAKHDKTVFLFWVQLKEDSFKSLEHLEKLVRYEGEDEEGRLIIDFSRVTEELEDYGSEIDKVIVWYRKTTIKPINLPKQKVESFNY